MRSLIFLVFLLTVNHWAFSQHIFSGRITSKQSNKPVTHGTVKLIKESISTSLDSNGLFSITSVKNIPSDTLHFTAVGYLPYKVPLADFIKGSTIEITEDIRELREVKIGKKKKEVVRDK
ncbi:MAG: hypothetical protein EOO43_24205 [Flavobacterium sp.]|nr:MAG: hypothetical protein EOO43_24205 [Flavobacterium sp.]